MTGARHKSKTFARFSSSIVKAARTVGCDSLAINFSLSTVIHRQVLHVFGSSILARAARPFKTSTRKTIGHLECLGVFLLPHVHEICYVHDVVNMPSVVDIDRIGPAELERKLAEVLRQLLSSVGWLRRSAATGGRSPLGSAGGGLNSGDRIGAQLDARFVRRR